MHDLRAFTMGEYRKVGWPTTICDRHSVGPGGISRNRPAPPERACVEAGMVLALEPHVNCWHLQDLVLVTTEEPVLLSPKFDTDVEAFVADA
jgi:hypothetical protein